MLTLFKLDKRSLSLLRMFLGVVLVFDFFNYASFANFYLSDEGLSTRVNFLTEQANVWNWSLLYISGSTYFVKFFLTWHFFTILFFIVGYKTRWQTFFLWVQIVSMHNRNWVVTNGGDDLLRCCLLILIFLPLGEIWTVDAKKKTPLSISTNSFFTVAFFCQLAIMYFASAIFKNHPIWNEEYSALYYALNLDLFVRPFGIFVKNHDYLLQPLTASAYYFELCGIALIFLGLFKKFFTLSRYLMVISFTLFHLGIDMMLEIGTFPYFAIALWSAFLPDHFWDSLSPVIHKIQLRFKQLVLVCKSYQSKLPNLKRPKIYLYNLLGIFFIFNLLFWPLSDPKFNLNFQTGTGVEFLKTTNRWLSTYQNWHLFAPYPKMDNVWVELLGETDDGKVVDLYRMKVKDHPLTAEEVHTYYQSEKWRKILLKAESTPLYQNWLTSYYCNHWSELAVHEFENTNLINVKIVSHNQLSMPRGIASRHRMENVLTTYQCP